MTRLAKRTSAACGFVLTALTACGGRMGDNDPALRERTSSAAGGSAGWGVTQPLAGRSSTTTGGLAGRESAGGTLDVAGGGTGILSWAGSPSTLKCPYVVDDMEEGTGRIAPCDHRVGVWYAFNNGTSYQQSQWPAVTTPGVPIAISDISGGRGNSMRAMHSYGNANGDSSWWAGVGVDLAFDGRSYGAYDASAFNGVTFWIRGSAKSRLEFRLGTQQTNAPEYGGTCSPGYCEPAATPFDLSSHWRPRWISFESMRHTGSYELTPQALTNLQFYCPIGCTAFDIWVDDVAFYSGPPSCCSEPPPSCRGEVTIANGILGDALGKGTISSCEACTQTSILANETNKAVPSSDLRGLTCFTNLGAFSIAGAPINDVSLFAELPYLQDLEITDARITDARSLAKLADLEALDLAKNAIEESSALSGIRGLKRLNLESNRLTEIRQLAEMPLLETLDLSGNAIADLTPIGRLTSLTSLDLSGNAIVDVSPLAALTQLTSLDLSNNQIVDLSPLAKLTRLTTLRLTGNLVARVTPLANLLALEELLLDKNQLDDLTGVTNLTRLTKLALTDNVIFDLRPLAKLDRITRLDLTRNRVTDVTGLNPIVSELTLKENLLVSLAPLSGMVRLVLLDVANNRVTDLTPIAQLPLLETLNVESNALVTLQPLATSVRLHTLFAASNRVTDLSPLVNVKGFDVINYERWSSVGKISVPNNAIDCDSQADNIAKLRGRKVEVTSDCP